MINFDKQNLEDSENINLKSDNINLLSIEEKKILSKLNSKANIQKQKELLNYNFYNLSLKQIFNNFLKTWNLIIMDIMELYNTQNSWKKILFDLLFIFTKDERLIYVGIMLIIVSFFMYFILLSS